MCAQGPVTQASTFYVRRIHTEREQSGGQEANSKYSNYPTKKDLDHKNPVDGVVTAFADADAACGTNLRETSSEEPRAPLQTASPTQGQGGTNRSTRYLLTAAADNPPFVLLQAADNPLPQKRTVGLLVGSQLPSIRRPLLSSKSQSPPKTSGYPGGK